MMSLAETFSTHLREIFREFLLILLAIPSILPALGDDTVVSPVGLLSCLFPP